MTVQFARAQKSFLALDEHHQYIYYQVVGLPGAYTDSLHAKALEFIRQVFPQGKVVQTDSSAAVNGKFTTYSVLAFAKHENGEVRFVLNIECKDNKYRYWFTDFEFIPYEKNRYGVFVPVNGIDLPLEKLNDKLDKKEADGCLDQTGTYCKQTGERFKQFMAEDHASKKVSAPTAKKVVTDKW